MLDASADVTIAVDPATNSLIVIGSERATKHVAELVAQLEAQLPQEPGQVRYITLPETADAAGLARLVDQTLRMITPIGGERGALRQRVAVIPDATNNALVLTCTDHDFERVADLIAVLAKPPAAEEVIVKVYPLRTITAERASSGLQALIGSLQPTPTSRRSARRSMPEPMRTLAVKLLAGENSDG